MSMPFIDARLVCSAHSMCIGRRSLLRFTDVVKIELRRTAAPLLEHFRGVIMNVAVNDLPNVKLKDLLTEDDTALLLFQTVGRRTYGSSLFPDFVYGGWPYIGLDDFDAFVGRMAAGARSPAHMQALWVGNANMHRSRQALVQLAREHGDRIDARHVLESKDSWVDLGEHARWKYLIDLAGTGFSARLKLLPHANRPLLVSERPYFDWASSMLLPHEHFVPISENMTDLIPALDALDAAPLAAQAMADAATTFARAELSFAAALRHAVNLTTARLARLVDIRSKRAHSRGLGRARLRIRAAASREWYKYCAFWKLCDFPTDAQPRNQSAQLAARALQP